MPKTLGTLFKLKTLGLLLCINSAMGSFEFSEGHTFSVTQVCIDNGHLRPFHPVRQVCHLRDDRGHRLPIAHCPFEYRTTLLLKIPITQMKRYDLGDERHIMMVGRIQTRNLNLAGPFSPLASSVGEGLFNIPSCPNSMIQVSDSSIEEVVPEGNERLILTALFQHGITLIRQESLTSKIGIVQTLKNAKEDEFSLQFQAPQCQNGEIEFSEEFINYLETPFSHDFLFHRLGGEGSGSGLYNPVLDLRLIGGEGSGSGRIVGGEGSGSGRALEGRRFDPLTPTAGDITVNVKMNWFDFINGDGLSSLIDDLLHGEQVPEELIEVQCQ